MKREEMDFLIEEYEALSQSQKDKIEKFIISLGKGDDNIRGEFLEIVVEQFLEFQWDEPDTTIEEYGIDGVMDHIEFVLEEDENAIVWFS